MIYPEVQLPSKESSHLSNQLAEALPAEYKGTWYRVVEGVGIANFYSYISHVPQLDSGDEDDDDVIVITPNKPPRRGQLHRYTAGVYLLDERITVNRLVGGWLLEPSVSNLLKFSFHTSY
jgi:hypothetical protein